ncbi:MAG: CotH kinase family protein, partial [Bacteroidota bacterium]
VINDDYRGVYLFTERIKRDKNRVNVKKVEPHFAAGDSLTGGYILKFDRYDAPVDDNLPTFFESGYNADNDLEKSVPIAYVYPKPEDLTIVQRDYISLWVNTFEDALAGDNFTSPVLGYRPYVDLESFIDFLIINEISRNVDGYRLSTFLYKERDSSGGKLHMGPVWDFNLAFGNADYCEGGEVAGWAYDFGQVCPNDFFQLPFWWRRLLQDPAFNGQLVDRWNALRANEFSDNNLNAIIDALVDEMGDAPRRNFERWPVLEEYVWPNAFIGGSYPAEIDYLKNWVVNRTAWIDSTLNELTPVQNVNFTSALSLSPNPTDGKVRLTYEANEVIQQIRVYDTYGRLYLSSDERSVMTNIDLSTLPAGTYFFQAQSASGAIFTGKVIKQ